MKEPTQIKPINAFSFKRRKSYWEPVFAPGNFTDPFPLFGWNTNTVTALKDSLCRSDELVLQVKSRPRHTIRTTTFQTCDFDGTFNFTKLTFDSCRFIDCDFMDSEWESTKFTNCTFEESSLSTVIFTSCQFIECNWKKIGMSSNEMHFINCQLSNPNEFISAAYTNLDRNVLQQKNTTPEHQKFRLEGTKAKVARLLLINLQGQGDDDSFYDAIKTHTIQTIISKIETQKYNAFFKPTISSIVKSYTLRAGYFLELVTLRISGNINGWGGNVGRALIFGIAIILIFWWIYFATGIAPVFSQAGLAALEITLLIGYTKYTTLSTSLFIQSIFAANMILGLWWYGIFVPTVVNRINRINL
jgi:hypothetical protein